MSKALEFAYSKYPQYKKGVLYDLARNSIIEGYHQAEKDLQLTWQDARRLSAITFDVRMSYWAQHKHKDIGTESFWKEVLDQFNK